MADKKISATMATSIALNTLGASESVKSLTQAVNSANSAWKAQESMLKSTGDYLEASKARYEGLGNTISAQESKIEALKNKQSGLNVETNEGAEQYLKYQQKIDQATTKLNSLQSQQERAKTAMETQKSGVIDLNNALKNQESMYTSLASKLEAEGNHTEALKTKQSGLSESITKQNELFNKEKEILGEIAEKSGTASNAYAKQATRVNELGTKIAETKTKLGSINEELSKKPSSGLFSGIIAQLKDTSTQEEKTKERMSQFGERVKSIVSGAALFQGLQSLGNSLKGVAENGYEAAENATLVKERMEGVGFSEKDIASLSTQMKQLKENTNMSADSVNKLQMRFYDNTHSIDKAKELTQGVASLQDQLKLSSQQSDSFSMALNRIETSGTVTASSLGKLEKSAPGFSTAFQKASGMSVKSFDALVSSGKMTNDQFNDILSKASKNYKKNSDTFNTTSGGALHKLQQTWKDTQQSLMTPLIDVSATGLSALSKALDNKATQSAISQLGKGIADLSTKATKLISYLTAHAKDITSITGSILSIAKIVGMSVWSMFSGVIETIGKAFGSFSSSASKSKDPLDRLSASLKAISSHKTAIEDITKVIVTGFLGAKVLGGMVTLGKNIAVAVGAFNKLKKALQDAKIAQTAFDVVANMNPFGLIVIGITAVVAGFALLYKHSAKFRSFVNSLIKSAQDCWKNVVKFFKALWKDTVGVVTNLYKDVTGWFGNMKKGIASHVSDTWKNTKNAFSDGWNNTKKLTQDGVSKVGDWFNNMKKGTTDIVSDMWKGHKKTFQDGYKVVGDYTQTWHDLMTGKWGKVGSDLKNTLNDLVKFWKSVFKDAYDWINNLTGGRLGDVFNTFKSIFDKIKGVVSGAIDSVHHSFVDIARGIIKPFNDLLGGLEKGINWVLDKVGASQIKATWSIPLPAYAQGTKDTHQGGLAMVNDGGGSHYREMYRLPTGQIGMFPKERNMVVNLPKGTSVLDGEKSNSLAKMLGIPMYASGIGSFFEGIWDKGKDLLEDADKIIANPIDFLSGVFDKMVGGLSSKISLASDIITSLPKTIAQNAVNWIKSLFNGNAGGSQGSPSGSGVQRWASQVKDALQANGLSTSADMVNKVLRQIATESGGNEKAVQGNIGDINNRTGNLAKGLMQTITTTFNANKFPGHGDIFNGYDNLLAALHYAKKTYGSNLSALGNGHGYANGGLITQEQIATLGEGNKQEMVIPLELQNSSRAYTLLGETITRLAKNDSSLSSGNQVQDNDIDSEIKDLKDDVSEISTMFKALLELMGENVKATKNIGDKKARYTQQAKDMALASYQSLQ